jgi:SAM-dependent methyltransferase/uncharacterized protein YbaR (Trm112 family)
VLRCPSTGDQLRWRDGNLSTINASRNYPVANGVPILVDEQLSVFSPDEIVDGAYVNQGAPPIRGFLRRIIPGKTPGKTMALGTAERYQRFCRELRQRTPDRPLVLVIGGGILGVGVSSLLEHDEVDLIETDVYLGPRVAVVCDGHHLPFADETFDGVIIQAVLEHVLDPARVVSEIHRVLRPGALVYAETPFMQQVHEGAYDFTRWTELGHRRLFRMFDEIDRGICAGPGSVLLWSLCYFARSIPTRRSAWQSLLEKLTVLTFFWLKYTDRLLAGHVGAADGASGVFFMGSKATQAIPDRDLLAGYRGTIGRPVRRDRVAQ